MTLQSSLRYVAVISLIALFAVGGSSAYAQRAETNVPAGIQVSKDLGRANATAEINITVHLQLPDKTAFDKAVAALYDPASPTFHKWMTNADLRKYAPTEGQRQIVRQELERNGLAILSTDALGFTIRAHGSIASVESAFNTELHEFEYTGRAFRANVRDARLSGEAGGMSPAWLALKAIRCGRSPLTLLANAPGTRSPQLSPALGHRTCAPARLARSRVCRSAPAPPRFPREAPQIVSPHQPPTPCRARLNIRLLSTPELCIQ
jgi:hypothetical protein